jgi:hypothetical protein
VPSPEQQRQRRDAIANHVPFLRKAYRSYTEYIVVDQTTRRDSLQSPALQPYLQHKPSLAGDSEDKKKKSDQMIASDRLIMGGSKLYSRWDFNGTSVEEGFIYDALLEFAKSPYLGGKGNRGNGLVSIDIWYNTPDEQGHLLKLDSSQVVSERVTAKLKDYRDYLDSYKAFLSEAKESPAIKELLGAS